MRFYKQGPHDGLCGFIAVLNAFRILEHGADHEFACDDDHEFFDEAVAVKLGFTAGLMKH